MALTKDGLPLAWDRSDQKHGYQRELITNTPWGMAWSDEGLRPLHASHIIARNDSNALHRNDHWAANLCQPEFSIEKLACELWLQS